MEKNGNYLLDKLKRDGRQFAPRYNIDTCIAQTRIDKTEQDRKNRKEVKEKIYEYMKNGKSQEEAVGLVLQDKEITKKFKYLENNGINLRQCFINWTTIKIDKSHYNNGDER